jgi:hypothetical protein
MDMGVRVRQSVVWFLRVRRNKRLVAQELWITPEGDLTAVGVEVSKNDELRHLNILHQLHAFKEQGKTWVSFRK